MRASITSADRSCNISTGRKKRSLKCKKPLEFPTKRGRNGRKNWKIPIRTCGNRPNPSDFCYTYVVFQPTPATDTSSNVSLGPGGPHETSIENYRHRNRNLDRDRPSAAFRGERE